MANYLAGASAGEARGELRHEQHHAPEGAFAERRALLRHGGEYLGAHVAVTGVAPGGIDGKEWC